MTMVFHLHATHGRHLTIWLFSTCQYLKMPHTQNICYQLANLMSYITKTIHNNDYKFLTPSSHLTIFYWHVVHLHVAMCIYPLFPSIKTWNTFVINDTYQLIVIFWLILKCHISNTWHQCGTNGYEIVPYDYRMICAMLTRSRLLEGPKWESQAEYNEKERN
jgi:hypothetical protein